jgi:hypothetical protein
MKQTKLFVNFSITAIGLKLAAKESMHFGQDKRRSTVFIPLTSREYSPEAAEECGISPHSKASSTKKTPSEPFSPAEGGAISLSLGLW